MVQFAGASFILLGTQSQWPDFLVDSPNNAHSKKLCFPCLKTCGITKEKKGKEKVLSSVLPKALPVKVLDCGTSTFMSLCFHFLSLLLCLSTAN